MIDLTGPVPPWPDAARSSFAAAVSQALAAPDAWETPWLHGDSETRSSFARLLDRSPDRVLITGGVRAAALSLAALVVDAVVERPTFADVPGVLRAAGTPVRSRAWADFPGVPPAAGRRLWWVTSPCRNPDGASVDTGTAAFLAERAAAGDLVVQNTTYQWFQPDHRLIPGALEVGTVSKLAGGGARIGWLVSPGPIEPAVLHRNSAGPARAWQRAWAGFVGSEGFALLRDSVTGTVRRAAAAFAGAVAAPRDAAAPPAPFALLALPAGRAERDAVTELERRGVRVGAGADFQAPVPSLRVAFFGVDEAAAAAAAGEVRAEVGTPDGSPVLVTEGSDRAS